MPGRLHSGFSILWWNSIREKLFNRENQICFLKKISIMHENPPWMAEEWTGGSLSLLCFHGLQNVTVITMLAFHSGCPKMVFQPESHDLLQDEKKPIAEESSAHFWVDLRISSASFDSDSMAWSIFPTLTLLKMSSPSIAFYNPHGGHFLVGPPHHHKQHT